MDSFGDGWQTYGAGRTAVTIDGKEYCQGFMEGSLKEAGILLVAPDVDLQPEAYPSRMSINFGSATHIVTAEHWVLDLGMEYSRQSEQWMYGWFCGDTPHRFSHTVHDYLSRSTLDSTFIMPWDDDGCRAGTSYRESPQWKIRIPNGLYTVALTFLVQQPPAASKYWDLGCVLQPEGDNLELLSGRLKPGVTSVQTATVSVLKNLLTLADHWLLPCVPNRIEVAMVYGIGSFVGTWDEALSASYGAVLGLTVEQGAGPSLVTMSHPHFVPSPMSMRITEFVMQPADYGRDRTDWVVSVSPGGDRLTFSSGRTFLRRTPCTGGNITDALQPTGDCQATAGGAVVVGNCSAQRFQAELPQGAGTMAVRVLAPAAGPGAPVLAVSAALPREHAPAVTARLGAHEDNCTAAAAAGGMQLSCTVPWPAGQARISLQAIPGPAGAGPIRVEAVSLECAAPVRLATQDSEIRNTLSPGDARSGDSRAAGPTTSPSSAPTQLPTRPPSASPRSGPPAGAPQTGAPAVAPTRTPYTTGTDADLSACISRRSGDLCVPTCPSGHQAPSPFVLSCATDGSFDSSPAGMCAVDTSCGGGPLPGSAVPHADFSGCASLRTGDTCGVLFSCPSGYTAPPGRLELHCDPLTKMFNASKAGGCARNPCGVPLRGTPRADYTFCLHNRTKDPCTPACEEGWTVNGSFELVCSAAVIGGATRYLFDASSPALGAPAGPAPAVGCVPNSCAEGPAPESLTPPLSASQFAACRAMVSGQTCNISACAPPYELSEQQLPLICSSSRTFRASAIQCVLSSKPTKCTGGPLPGTASANATYTHCNKLASGDSCLVAFACATGFTSPKGILSLECDKVNGTYNASEGGDCIPNPCLTPLQTSASADSGGAAYGDCTAKVSGQTCRPSCPPGSSPSSDIALVCSRVQFGGEPQYVFDVGDSKCVPNSCSGGVRGALPFGLAGVAEDCLAKVTGQKCGLLCERGMVSEGDGTITLVCDENGTFEPGDGCYPDIGGNTKCDGGPIPGTAAEGGDYSSCTAAYSGSVCSVQWNCPLGYAAPNKQLIMHCDLMTGMYDASPAGNCTPKQCTAPLRVPPGADYSGCTALRTGGRCTPSCPPGHRPAGSFLLTCSDIQIGGRVEYVFDVAGVGCITNVCSNGPLPATLTPFMDAGCFASCIGNQTGAQCSPSCPAGFTLQPQQLGLVCAEDGTFSAAPWTCSPPPPPPPPPQCDPSACGSNGAPLADCSCSCSGNWAGADCAQCPPPYREHLGCTAPDLPSFSVSLGAESIGSFDLQGFLADAKSGMQDVKAEPQVSFVCLLPASRAAAGVTEADRRSSNCCRQPAGAQKLCTPGGAATRRGAPLGAELVAVLDVDVVGTEGGSTGDPQVAEAVTSAVQAAAAGAGGQAVAVGACGADGVKCGGVCVDRAGHCSGHGAASALGGECLCKCDKGFAGQRCEHCATGGTLCGVSPAQIAPLAGAGELLVSGTWDAVLPSSCRCPEGGAPAAAPCGAVGCQARHSSTGMRTALWAGCAEGNSTVRCAAPLRIDPGNFQLWLVLNGRDEPLAVAADGQGALSFSSIGAAGRMEVRDPLGAGVCMSTAVLPLFSQESAATSSGGSPATAGPAPAPEAPGWWRAQVYGRDSAGADVGAYSPTTCVPYRIRTERIGGGRGPALASRTACTPAQAPPCPSGWDCGGFRVGGAELAARGITAAGEYSVAIVTHSVPPFFPDQLPCDFQLIVLAGTPVAVVLDSRTEPPGWDLLLRPLSPPAVVRVMDAYGNYLTGGERRWTQSGGQWVHRELTPADLVPLYVWFTDANSTRVVTRTPAAGLTTPISKYSAAHIAEDGRGVIAEALSGAAYGRAYALCVSLSDPLTAPAGSGTLRINLPLPRCSGAGGAAQRAVYGQASCEPCPTGLVCDGSHRTRVLPGYWRAMPWDPSPTRCPLPSTCVGSPEEAGGPAEGAPVDEAAAAPDETDTPQSELEPGLCAPGAVGVLCSQCEPGWRMVQIKGGDGECRECGDPIYPYIAAAELLAAFCLLLLLCWLNIPSVLQRTGRSGQVLKLLVEALQISRLLRHVPVVSDSMVGINLIVPLVEFKPDHALLCELPNTVTLMQEILVYGFLPFVVIPFILLAQLFIKNVRFQVQRRRSRRRRTVIRPVAAELVLDPNQQVLAACGGCSSWGCHHCDTCHHNMCLHCMPLCVAKKHPISTVPLMGDGSQLKLPRRFELALGVMIGAFLVMPTMMEKFTSRWRCVQYTEPLGEGCSPLHPELCAEESRLVADARVRCDDVVTATASASFMVGWGLVASGLLFIALRAVGSRKLNGADDDPKLRDLPLQGLHSTIAVGAMRTTYFAYRKKYWWWESYNFIFKTSIFAFFSIDLPKAFLLSMMVCAASLLAHSQARPYHDQWALLFSLVVHVMLSAAMLTAAWIMQSPAASEGQLRYSDLDDFTRSLCAVVSVSCAFVFVVLFVLLVRLIRQAWPLALQIKEKGFVEDEDSVDPEAVHTARVVARIMGSGPRVMTESAVETWRARYEGEVPSLGSEEEYQHLFTVYMGLLHQADRGPVGELCRALRTPWGRSELEWYIAVSSAHLSSTKGASLPGVSGVALLILELYTMEGADIDDKLGYDVPRWQELEDFPFSSRAREIALRAWDQRKSGAAGEKEPQPALEEILRTNGITEEDEGDVVDQVQDLMRMFEEGLLTRIEKAQAAYRKYKADVGDTRNPSAYKNICWALRTLQQAVLEGRTASLLSALTEVLKQGLLNFTMVLMHSARPVAELHGGQATLWRGLGGLPAQALRWHRLLRPGSFVAWAAPTSTSFDEGAARDFATGRAILFRLHGVTEGIPLWSLSRYPQERELLIAPFSRWEVESIEDEGPRLVVTMWWRGTLRGSLDELAAERLAAAEASLAALLRSCAAPHAAAASAAAAAACPAAQLLPAPQTLLPPPRHRGAACESPSTWSVASGVADTMGGALLSSPPDAPVPPSRVAHHQAAALAAAERSSASSDTAAAASPACLVDAGGMRLSPRAAGRPARLVLADPGEEASRLSSPAASQRGCPLDAADFGSSHLSVNPLRSPRFKRVSGASLSHVQCGGDLSASGTPLAGHSPDIG